MPKIMCLADLHLTEHKPKCRPDDEEWLSTVRAKLEYMSHLIRTYKIDTVAIAGDIFDSVVRQSHEFMSLCLDWFYDLKHTIGVTVVAIPGNHDLINADVSRLKHTPYGVLVAARLLQSPEDLGWGCIPYGESTYKGDAEIVIGHYGLWYGTKPYPTAPDRGNVEWFVHHRLPATCKLFITGHYHVPFVTKVRGTTVVNCGCPFRLRADLIDYLPKITVADIHDGVVTTKEYAVPLQYNIRRDYLDDIRTRDTAFAEMLGSITGDFEFGLNFTDNFYNLTAALENKAELHKEFERCINGYYDQTH